MTKHEHQETRLLRAHCATTTQQSKMHHHHISFSKQDPFPYTDVVMHHHISESKKHRQDAFSFRKLFPDDPATNIRPLVSWFTSATYLIYQDFVPWLKDHLLGHLLNLDYDGDETVFSDADWNTVWLVDNWIYSAKVLRINYITYDIRQDQDSMNPHTHCDVMVLSPETGANTHSFWYARVLGVFHTQVLHTGPAAKNRSVQRMEFLWVQWLGMVHGHRYGFKAAHLPKVCFVEVEDKLAFRFLDPSLTLRSCHLIPAFSNGWTMQLLKIPHSAAHPPGERDGLHFMSICMYLLLCLILRHLIGF